MLEKDKNDKRKERYKKAQDLYEAALEFYNPIRYAVLKTKESLEKRNA